MAASEATSAQLLRLCKRAEKGGNHILASDIVATMIRGEGEPFDFMGLRLVGGQFVRLDLTERGGQNLELSDSIVNSLVVSNKSHPGIRVSTTRAERVFGVTAAGLPAWLRGVTGESFDSAENVAKIKRIGLNPGQLMLTTILKKTFGRRSGGTKAEALIRGLGRLGSSATVDKVLNLLIRDGILERFKGDEGWVYRAVRAHGVRMKKITDELKASKDPLWLQVADF